MSGVVRGVKKIFKPVFRAVKKIAPYAVLAGAVIFTAGAALAPAGAMAGGWAGASASIGSLFGPTLAPIVSGAVYQSGLGAAIGGGIAAATGQKISRGIKGGALVGSLTGAATGLLAPGAVPTRTLAQANAPPGTTTVGQGAGTITRTPLDPAAPNPANSTQLADASAAASPAIKPPSPTSLDGSGAAPQPSWFERNQGIVGPAISATGTGLLSMGQGDADIEAEERRDERIRENYGDVSAYTGLLRPDDVRGDGVVRPTPGEKYRYSFEVAWNPQTRRLEKIPLTTA